jgi:hypothetical protein
VKTRFNRFISLAAFVLLLVPAWAGAATIYVNAAASNSGDGSAPAPYTTIQPALDAAVSGDEVVVLPGIYYGTVMLKNGVTLKSSNGPAATIIDGLGEIIVVNSAPGTPSWSAIEGFTIRNGNILVHVWNNASFWAYSWVGVDRCVLTDATMGVWQGPASNIQVTRTVIRNMTMGAAFNIWSAGTYNNLTIDNAPWGFGSYDGGFYATNATLSNVGAVRYLEGNSGWLSGSNNNYWNYGQMSQVTRYTVSNIINTPNSMEVDPMFEGAGAGNYRLLAGSPLIDRGVEVGLPYEGGAPDIGAYEAQADLVAMTTLLAESYQSVSATAFKNAPEQRRYALNNKLMAVIDSLKSVKETMPVKDQLDIYNSAINKLLNDIRAKADGSLGGNPGNDWITDPAEQARLDEKVQGLVTTIRTRIAALGL